MFKFGKLIITMHYIYLFTCLFSIGLLTAMDQPQSTGNTLSTVTFAAENVNVHSLPSKSLYKHFGIPYADILPEEMTVMIAAHVLKKSEWWHKKSVLKVGDWVNAVTFHPTQKLVVTGSSNNRVCLWNYEGNLISERELRGRRVYGVALHPTKPLLATALDDGTTELYNYQENKKSIFRHLRTVNEVALHPTEKIIATASEDCRACLWLDYEGDAHVPLGHRGSVYSVALHPTEKIIATASGDGTACLWDYQGNKKITLEHVNSVNSVALHPKEKLVATASSDCTVCLWDLEGNKKVTLEHECWVNKVALHPTENLIATASHDCTACLWDYKGNKKVTLVHDFIVTSVALHPTEKLVATASSDGAAYLWQRHEPTLEQLLLRQVLKDYAINCIDALEVPEICATQEEVPVWMAQKFNLEKNELAAVWQSMPEALQKSIFNTICFRAEEIAKIIQ